MTLVVSAPANAGLPTSGGVTCLPEQCFAKADNPGTAAQTGSSTSKPAKAQNVRSNVVVQTDPTTQAVSRRECSTVPGFTCLIADDGTDFFTGVPWTPANPAAPAPAVTAAQVGQMAVSMLAPEVPTIHSSVPTDEESGRKGTETFGLVGMPIWFWSDGPMVGGTATASAGPFTVTAVAKLAHVAYDMGDGHVIRCAPMSDGRVGTKYPGEGIEPSPTCGYEGYQKTSRKYPGLKYTITSTATWNVTWSGADTGATTLTTQDVGHVPIGEAQALITSYGA